MEPVIELVKSNKGGYMFVFDGYLFEKSKEIKLPKSATSSVGNVDIKPSTSAPTTSTVYVTCARKRNSGCKARMVLIKNNGEYKIKKACKDDDHNHLPLTEVIQEKKIVNMMKDKLRENPSCPLKRCYSSVVQETLTENSDSDMNADILNSMPVYNKVKTSLYRERTRLRTSGTSDSFVLDNESLMVEDDTFILFETKGDNQIIGFGTPHFLGILCSIQMAKAVYMQGTSGVTPRPFCQLYTIHAYYKNKMLPFIYVLLPNETEDTYFRMFQEISAVASNYGYNFQPGTIMTDYDSAAINAAKRVFPNVVIKGCFYHFNQILWKNFCTLGLSSFKSDPRIMKFFRLSSSLSLVPLEHIDKAWLLIHDNTPAPDHPAYGQCHDFMEYFVSTWLEGPFSPEMWNQYENFDAKLNYYIGEWYRTLNRITKKNREDVDSFINYLKSRHLANKDQMDKLDEGMEIPKIKNKAMKANDIIQTLTKDFEGSSDSLEKYMLAVGNIILVE